MKPIPILLAVLVTLGLYAIVFERDRLAALMAGMPEDAAETQNSAENIDTSETEAVSVVAMRSLARPVENAVVVRGQTEAARQVDVRAQIAGLVISEPLRKGAFVDRGDILCEIEPGTRPAALAEAEARLAEARIEATAADRLAEGGFGSETRKASAQAALQAAAAMVDVARTETARLQIRAPFAGLLESDAAELGSLMQPGEHCATIIQLNPIKIVGFLPETAVGQVSVGAPAQGRLATGRLVQGQVTFLSRSADPDTRTFRVEIAVPNDDLSVRDGQSAEIAITASGVRAHLVPQSALTLDNDGTMGLRTVAEQETVAFQPVDIVRDTMTGIWVTGLPDEAIVITTGQEYVTDGVPVAVTLREPLE